MHHSEQHRTMCRQRGSEPGDGGHTLVEALIALALLLTVVAPTGGALAVMLAQQSAQDRVVALALVEQVIEEALMRESFSDSTWVVGRPTLKVRRSVSRDSSLVMVTITAKRAGARHRDLSLRATVFAPED